MILGNVVVSWVVIALALVLAALSTPVKEALALWLTTLVSVSTPFGKPSALRSDASSRRRLDRKTRRAGSLALTLFLFCEPLAHASVSSAEHNALVDLYNGTNGAGWANKTNWLVAADECTWFGVTCDPAHTVVQMVALATNNLNGTMPASLGNLASLQNLNLTYNRLSGSIPLQLGNLKNLRGLFLYFNQLSGSIPPQLGSMSSMQGLYLDDNQLSGSIPPELASLTGLQNLFLYNNQLSGSIPAQLGSLTLLLVLELRNNQLTGSIPPELGNLKNLQYLYLRDNRLSGSIPPELGNLTSLQYVLLDTNQLTGSIPSTLKNLTSLVPTHSRFGFNALFSTDSLLTSFLNGKEGGDWQSTQTIAPGNVSTSAATPTAITVSWTPIAYTADGGFYQVSYSTTAGGPYSLFATSTPSKSSSSLTVTGLATNTRYFFVVSATTQANINNKNTVTSGFSAEVSGLTAAISPPVVNAFTANPSTIIAGQSSTLGWTATNTTTVSINGVAGTQPANGSVSVSPSATTTYTLEATGPGGTATAATTITVNTAPPTIISFVASPATIIAGQSGTLSWATANATLVSIGGVVGTQPLSGSVSVSPTTTTTYELTAAGSGGTATANTTVTVLGAFSSLQLLLPGEIAAPGSPTGKAGVPAVQVAGMPFTVVVNAVDSNYNLVTSASDSVQFTGSDPGAALPPRAPLVSGSQTSNVTLRAGRSQTITASDVSDPSKGASTSAPILVKAVVDPAVAVALFPAGLVALAGTLGATDSYTLINTGGTPATINLTQSGSFFIQSPTNFTLQPGAIQVISLFGVAQPAGFYEGTSILNSTDVPPGFSVPVRLLAAVSAGSGARASANSPRLDVSAPVGTNPSGTVEFTNSGNATVEGILISDSPWLIPQSGVVTLPPGGTGSVSFTIDRSKRPEAVGPIGSIDGKFSLVFLTSGASTNSFGTQPNDGPGTSSVSVSIVDRVSQTGAVGSIPPLGPGEVALVIPGLPRSSGEIGDLFLSNTDASTSLRDTRIYYVSPSVSPHSSQVGQVLPLASITVTDLSSKNAFGLDGQSGGMQVRGSNLDNAGAEARLLKTSLQGSYGNSLPIFRSDRGVAQGDSLFLAGLKKESGFHTNLYVQEVSGSPGSVKIDFLDARGQLLGQRAADALPSFGIIEILDAAPNGAAAVRISPLGSARIAAYGLAVDETTGDSWNLVDWTRYYAASASASEPNVLLLLGSAAGVGSRTDVSIVNKTATANAVTLRYTASGSSRRRPARKNGLSIGSTTSPEAIIERTRTITLDPLSSTTLADLLSNQFGVPSDSTGYLTITPAADVAISARTYTKSPGRLGTSGTGVAAIPNSSMLIAGQSKHFTGIEDAASASVTASAPATYRTNVGLIETSGQPVTVRVTMRYYFPAGLVLSGHTASSKDFTLLPGQCVMVTDAMKAIIGEARTSFGDLHNVQVDVKVIGGNGRVLAFIQSVDNGTGDTILHTN